MADDARESPVGHAALTSAAVPPVGAGDHVEGSGPVAVLYVDFACLHCAVVWQRLRSLRGVLLCVRHFPMPSKHRRSTALHHAAQAAAGQDAFWPFADAIFADQGHVDDPHLWAHAERLGLDVERFDRDRRSPEVGERVRVDFRSGVRAGIVGTPAAFHRGRPLPDPIEDRVRDLAGEPHARPGPRRDR